MNSEKMRHENHALEAPSIKSKLLRGLARIGLRRAAGAEVSISSQGEKNIKLHVHYSGHDTHDDFKKVGEYIDNPDTRPDIYLREGLQRTPEGAEYIQELQEVFDGKLHPGDMRFSPPYSATARSLEFDRLTGSGIAYDTIDLDANDPRQAELIEKIDTLYKARLYDPQCETFDEIVDSILQNIEKSARLQWEREQIMIEKFKPQIAKIVSARPDLQSKDHLKVLFPVGSTHTTLDPGFKKEGVDVSRSFPTYPHIWDYNEQLERAYKWGVTKSEDELRTLAAKIYLEDVIRSGLHSTFAYVAKDIVKENIYCRSIIDNFTLSEIEEVFTKIKTNPKVLEDQMRQKGLGSLPRNFNELLSRVAR